MVYQFSTLYTGVVQRMATTIKRQHPRPPEIVTDTCQLRVIAILNQDKGGGAESMFDQLDAAGSGADDAGVKFAVRCEHRGKVSGPRERLLVLTADHVAVYKENAQYFTLPPAIDQGASSRDGRDGMDMLTLVKGSKIPLDSISSLGFEMSNEPRITLSGGEGDPVRLKFADDTVALLFRSKMREALWGKGQAKWSGHTLAVPEESSKA